MIDTTWVQENIKTKKQRRIFRFSDETEEFEFAKLDFNLVPDKKIMLEVQLIGSQQDVDTTEANIIGLY